MTAITLAGPKINLPRLIFLDNLRAVAVLLVVGIHALSYALELTSTSRVWLALILTTVAVPIFFLADGYLLAIGNERKRFVYSAFVVNSVKRLVVPWFLFTMLYTLSRYFLEYAGAFQELLIVGHSFPSVVFRAYGAVFSAQLYFLLSLFIIRLLSPLFLQLYRLQSPFAFYGISFAVIVAANILLEIVGPALSIAGGQEPVLHAIWGVQFYVLGMMLAKAGEAMIGSFMLALQTSSFCIAFFLYKGLNLDAHILLQYAALLLMFALFKKFEVSNSVLTYVGKNTMEIYLLHSPIILKAVSMGIIYIGVGGISGFGLIVFLTTAVALLAAALIRKAPYGDVLFGVNTAASRKPATEK